jgi:hypothetical protein
LAHTTVDTLERKKHYPGRIRKLALRTDGYRQVGLSRGPEVSMHYVHDLVAAAFHGPKPSGFEVRHKNGRRAENQALNLHYGTVQENQRDRISHGTDIRGEAVYGAKLTPPEVLRIRRDPRGCDPVAADYGVCRSTIKAIRNRKTWAHV